jgi:hypothetical protein
MSGMLKTSTTNCEENVTLYEDTLFHTFAFQVPTGITVCPYLADASRLWRLIFSLPN